MENPSARRAGFLDSAQKRQMRLLELGRSFKSFPFQISLAYEIGFGELGPRNCP
jgi:hypothetical protein